MQFMMIKIGVVLRIRIKQINLINFVMRKKDFALATIGRQVPLRATRTMRGLSISATAVWVATLRAIAVMCVALETDSDLIFVF